MNDALWGKTGVYIIALILGFLLEILSQLQTERLQTMPPAKLYHLTLMREKYHNAAVICMLSAVAIATMLR
jgi:hypothetical protein